MAYIDEITILEKCTEGLSPAEVYKCQSGGNICYLKRLITNFQTRHTVSKERQKGQENWNDKSGNISNCFAAVGT